jgi:hypothetical protein
VGRFGADQWALGDGSTWRSLEPPKGGDEYVAAREEEEEEKKAAAAEKAAAEKASAAAEVGAVQVESSCPVSLKAPGFINP